MMKCLLALLLSSGFSNAHADTHVYQCKMANGHINFSDSPCRKNEALLRENTVANIPTIHSVVARPQPDEPLTYRRPFCDRINSREIHTRYNRLIQETEAALWRIRDGRTKDAWIAYYEQRRKDELQGCQ